LKLTEYLAIYAAILSTFVFLWNVLQSKAKIKVDLIHGVEGEGDEVKHGVYLFVRNLSSHEVHLSNLSLLYPYRSVGIKERLSNLWQFKRFPSRIGWVSTSLSNYSIEDGCPICLKPRKSHKVMITKDKLEEIFSDATERCMIGYAQDQLWNNTYSKVFKY
jgi:hypothetical protein